MLNERDERAIESSNQTAPALVSYPNPECDRRVERSARAKHRSHSDTALNPDGSQGAQPMPKLLSPVINSAASLLLITSLIATSLSHASVLPRVGDRIALRIIFDCARARCGVVVMAIVALLDGTTPSFIAPRAHRYPTITSLAHVVLIFLVGCSPVTAETTEPASFADVISAQARNGWASSPPAHDAGRRLAISTATANYYITTNGLCAEPITSQADCSLASAELSTASSAYIAGVASISSSAVRNVRPPGCYVFSTGDFFFNPSSGSTVNCFSSTSTYKCACRSTLTYVAKDHGVCTSPVMSASQCNVAAAFVWATSSTYSGYDTTSHSFDADTTLPRGCYRKAENQALFFNPSTTSSVPCSSARLCLCIAEYPSNIAAPAGTQLNLDCGTRQYITSSTFAGLYVERNLHVGDRCKLTCKSGTTCSGIFIGFAQAVSFSSIPSTGYWFTVGAFENPPGSLISHGDQAWSTGTLSNSYAWTRKSGASTNRASQNTGPLSAAEGQWYYHINTVGRAPADKYDLKFSSTLGCKEWNTVQGVIAVTFSCEQPLNARRRATCVCMRVLRLDTCSPPQLLWIRSYVRRDRDDTESEGHR